MIQTYLVIPAKAGIQDNPATEGEEMLATWALMDSRLRGNDDVFVS